IWALRTLSMTPPSRAAHVSGIVTRAPAARPRAAGGSRQRQHSARLRKKTGVGDSVAAAPRLGRVHALRCGRSHAMPRPATLRTPPAEEKFATSPAGPAVRPNREEEPCWT